MSETRVDPDCVFCKIIQGAFPSASVLETDHVVAFLDINPINPGHVLLVPRHHHADLSELPDEIAAHAGSLLPRLCRAVVTASGAQGFNVIINNGKHAGQTVDHGHWHIIPRFADDAVRWPWPQGKYEGDGLQTMQARIASGLGQ